MKLRFHNIFLPPHLKVSSVKARLLFSLRCGGVAIVLVDSDIRTGLDTTVERAGLPKIEIPQFVGGLIKLVLTFIGAVFLVLIIHSGYMWMTAQGNDDKITKAKDGIVAATLGLIIVLAAYAVVYYIIGALITEIKGLP